MNRDMIYKMVFEEIKESLEWACGCKDGYYSYYVDGVIALGDRILKELDRAVACEDQNKTG